MTEEEIYITFKGDWHKTDNYYLVGRKSASDFVSHVSPQKIFGIEGFVLNSDHSRVPLLGAIAHFLGKASSEDISNFLLTMETECPELTHYEFILDADSGMSETEVCSIIDSYTKYLREDESPIFVRIRELLKLKGIDPLKILVVESWPDDGQFWFGVIITKEKKVYQFGYDWLHKAKGDGYFREWNDLTMDHKFYDRNISAGLNGLEKGRFEL